jgi:iron complex transport system permease protein
MRRGAVLAAIAFGAAAVVAAAPFWGVEDVPFRALWAGDDDPGALILRDIRLPRVAMGFLAGAGLAAAGMAFQAMFRNPLATPFTLGVASGAALGASAAIHAGWTFALWHVPATSLCAFAGALGTIGIVYGLTRARRGFSTATMLLAGVALSFFFSSMILFLQYLSDFTQTFRMVRWVMGGLESVVGMTQVLGVLPFVFAGCAILMFLVHELNLLLTGEDLAAARGVALERTKLLLFGAASMMVAAVVAVCGPIGFVGLMAPHICRMLVGPDHRWLAPATILFGGAFLVLCDTAARLVMVGITGSPTELPVGILTALLGGPFFLWLLLREPPDGGGG